MASNQVEKINLSPKATQLYIAILLSKLRDVEGYRINNLGNYFSMNNVINEKQLNGFKKPTKNLGHASSIIKPLIKNNYIIMKKLVINNEGKKVFIEEQFEENKNYTYTKKYFSINKEKFYELIAIYLKDILINKKLKDMNKNSYEILFNKYLEDKTNYYNLSIFKLFKVYVDSYYDKYVDKETKVIMDKNNENKVKNIKKLIHHPKSIQNDNKKLELKTIIHNLFIFLGLEFYTYKENISNFDSYSNIIKSLPIKNRKILMNLIMNYYLIYSIYNINNINNLLSESIALKNMHYNFENMPNYFNNKKNS